MSRLKLTGKILGYVILTIVVWAAFDIWIHDYGIMPYYKYGVIASARNAYLYGFWSFAVLNVAVIAIIVKAWRYLVSLMLLMVSGAEDVAYYILLPVLNPARAEHLNNFLPDKLPWLNDNLWLRLWSHGSSVTQEGLLAALAAGLFLTALFLLFSFIPNLFSKEPIPQELPTGMVELVERVRSAKNKKQALQTAYEALAGKYRGYKAMTYLKLWRVWETDLDKIWQRSGFLHCTTMNYLLRIILIKSGWFKEEDIRFGYAMIWYISLHQYLKVRVAPNEWIKADLWYHHYGKKLGDYGHGFHA